MNRPVEMSKIRAARPWRKGALTRPTGRKRPEHHHKHDRPLHCILDCILISFIDVVVRVGVLGGRVLSAVAKARVAVGRRPPAGPVPRASRHRCRHTSIAPAEQPDRAQVHRARLRDSREGKRAATVRARADRLPALPALPPLPSAAVCSRTKCSSPVLAARARSGRSRTHQLRRDARRHLQGQKFGDLQPCNTSFAVSFPPHIPHHTWPGSARQSTSYGTINDAGMHRVDFYGLSPAA